MKLRCLGMFLLVLACEGGASAGELRAGAAAVDLVADDAMVIGGGIGPHKVAGQEGKLRASAVVIEDPQGAKVALVECDVLMVNRDVLDRAAEADRARDGHPVRPHPDQRDAHPSRADDGDDPRIRARGRVHAVRSATRPSRPPSPPRSGSTPVTMSLPARPGVDGRPEQPAPARQRDDLLGGPARRGRPADRPVRPRAARLGLPPQGRDLRGRDVQPLDPHHRRPQAGRPLARASTGSRPRSWRRRRGGRSSSSRGPRARRTTSTWPGRR